MSKELPRRLIDELVSRWTIGGLKTTFVEGPNDQRLMHLLQREGHCPTGFQEVDPCSTDAIEIPQGLLIKHGVEGTGAKQRVIAVSREMLERGLHTGFRGVVDIDLDHILDIDLSSVAVLYTDYSCMESYLWNVRVLNRLLIQFRCEGLVAGDNAEKKLFYSITSACNELSIVRVANETHPEWKLDIHQSDKSLSFSDAEIKIDIAAYFMQCKPPKAAIDRFKELIPEIRAEIIRKSPLGSINGHDLVWLLTYVLRELTPMQRRQVDQSTVENSLLAFGISNPELANEALFLQLAEWQVSAA